MDTRKSGIMSRGWCGRWGRHGAFHSVPNLQAAAASSSSQRFPLQVFLLCVMIGGALTLDRHDNSINVHGNSKALNANQEVKRFWGIQDVTAVAGQIFNFTIPSDAFTGKILQFVVTEAGEPSLPSWLHFDPGTRMFQGVPLEKNLGQYYISVKAYGPPAPDAPANGKSIAKDVFSIDVVEDSPDSVVPPTYTSQTQKCSTGESLTMATIILDTDMEALRPAGVAALVEKAATLLKLASDSLKLKPLGSTSRVFDGSALMAGPGLGRGSPLTTGTLLQWQVGCSGVVHPDHASRITEVEKLSKDGTLADELSVPVIGWHVTNQQAQLTRREKRQASGNNRIAGTPVPGIYPTRWPGKPTERIEYGTTEDTYAPDTRIVPTMVSPVFTQSSQHPHRHHHGSVPRERRPPDATDTFYMSVSPVVNQRYPYSLVASPVSTPVLIPEKPSRYVPMTSLDMLAPSRILPDERTPDLPLPSPVIPTDVPTEWTTSPIVTDATTDISPTKPTKYPSPTKSIPNSKPAIKNRMKKLSIVAGKVWNYTIPEDTFVDFEDGNTRNLKLIFMTAERTSVPSTSWIQFDPEAQCLYALPLEENIGKYEYILEAMDSNGDTSQDRLDIHVWQHQNSRAVHHEFTLKLKFPRWKFPVSIDWQMEVVRKLSKLYGDKDMASYITVRSVTTDPITISWANDTLPRQPCPKDQITMLMNKLTNEEGEITKKLKKVMKEKEFVVEEASVTYKGLCQPPSSTTPSTRTGLGPVLRNPIEQVNATVGEILRFKVPEDTFYDSEDGSTRFLTLSFLTVDSMTPPTSSWVQLNPKSQELYGLPFEDDVGQHEFMIAAVDQEGHEVSDVFLIIVHSRVPRKSPVEFSIHLDEDFDTFNRNTSRKVMVAWKLSKLFGDQDPRHLTVRSITKGSVVYSWTNNTLPHDPCPADTIRSLVHYLLLNNETPSSNLVEAMAPEFKVFKVDAMPLGVCLGGFNRTTVIFPDVSIHTTRPPLTDKGPGVVPGETDTTNASADDIYLTTIIPAVLIAIMLIIAALVACFLYRKKRKGKMTMQDTSTFTSKGIPIIFSDELDEKADPAKPPIIMKEEKPPLIPVSQEYPHSVSASSTRGSTPQVDRKETMPLRGGMHHGGNPEMVPMLHHGAAGDPHFSPPYQPPPPFTTSRDHKNTRPKATPAYRQPPPYVPP